MHEFKNGMLKISTLISLLLLLAPSGLQSQALTVWPGDANNNGIANHVDLLNIGINYDSTGPARTPASLACYADCDGSGIIDSNDVNVLVLNYGQVHGALPPQDTSTQVQAGAPALILNILDSLPIIGIVTANLDILLGDSGNPVSGLYGLAFTITFDPAFVDQVLTSFNGGWLNLDGNTQIIQHVDSLLGRIEIAIVRTDGQAISGSGSLGSLGIVMDDNVRGIDASGAAYNLQARSDTLLANFLLSTESPHTLPSVQVYPVPATQVLHIRCAHVTDADLRIVDIRGVTYLQQHFRELNTHQLSVADWPAGVYFLEIRNKEGHCRAKVIVGPGQ
jgi:hypothetical protein